MMFRRANEDTHMQNKRGGGSGSPLIQILHIAHQLFINASSLNEKITYFSCRWSSGICECTLQGSTVTVLGHSSPLPHMSCQGAPVGIGEVSASGPSILSRELLLGDPEKRQSPTAGGRAPSTRTRTWGRRWFCLSHKERRGSGGAEVVRVSKALVGPAGVLAPVNQAVIE